MKKIFLILLIAIFSTQAFADKWKPWRGKKNLVPVHITFTQGPSTCYSILTFEDGSWTFFNKKYFTIEDLESTLRVNTVGTIYYLTNDKGEWIHKYKWVENKKLTKKRRDAQKKTISKIIVPAKTIVPARTIVVPKKVVQIESNWTKVSHFVPVVDTVVLVKYKNGVITTAYLNDKKEWKLNTDKEKISGGRTVTTIVEWKTL